MKVCIRPKNLARLEEILAEVYRPPLRVHVLDLLTYSLLVFTGGFTLASSLAVGVLFYYL